MADLHAARAGNISLSLAGLIPANLEDRQSILAEQHTLDTEEGCAAFLFVLKWPNGFVCPICRHSRAYTISTRRLPLYECTSCHYQTSLTTDTVMEGSRTPLVKWFAAIRHMSQSDEGISAMALSRKLQVTYKTGWNMLHRIRSAMAKNELAAPLEGAVTVHDAIYARPALHDSVIPHDRETRVLVGASMTDAGQAERVTFQTVKQEHLSQGYILSSGLERFKESRLDWNAEVADCQFRRYTSPRNKKTMPLFKAAIHWLNTTFHGIGRKHLEKYLLEFCCRANLILAGTPLFPAISRICASSSPA